MDVRAENQAARITGDFDRIERRPRRILEHGEQVARPADLDDALQRAFASGKPAVIDVLIDQNTLAPVVYKV